MIVHHVEVVLHVHLSGGPLGDVLHDLLHYVVGKVLSQKVEDKAVRGLEVEVLKMPGVDLSEEDGSAKTNYYYSSELVEHSEFVKIIVNTSKIFGEHYRKVSIYTSSVSVKLIS